jgi:hypothetical protein
MCGKLQQLMSRSWRNSKNKHNKTSEKEKSAFVGKIILNKQMYSEEIDLPTNMRFIQG